MLSINPQWTVVARRVNAVLEVAEHLGANRRALLEQAAIREEWLSHPDNRLPVSCFFDLFEQVAAITGNPDIGLYVGRIDFFGGQDIQRYLSTLCSTFREYLNLVPSLLKISGDIGEVVIAKEGKTIRLEWRPLLRDTGRLRFLSDATLCSSAMTVNALCIYPIPVIRAHFSYPRPENLCQLQLAFGEDLHFGQPVSCLYFERASLDYPLIQAGRELHEAVIHSMQVFFEDDHTSDSFLRSLRDRIARTLPSGAVNIDPIARELNISRRTLQRRLEEKNTNFQRVLQAVRAQLATRYLSDKRMGVTEIAFLLGYSEPASFTKAFKSWYGVAPSDYRLSPVPSPSTDSQVTGTPAQAGAPLTP